MFKRSCSRLAALFAGIVLVAACSAVTEPPSKDEVDQVRKGEKAIVIFRVAAEDGEGGQLEPFASSTAEDNVGLALGNVAKGGAVESYFPRFVSAESRKQGWTYLILQPGSYWLTAQPPRWGDIFSYLHRFQVGPRWVIRVPEGSTVVYAGTLYLRGIFSETLFGGKYATAYVGSRSEVRNEEPLAAALVAKHWPEFAPLATVLMEPQRQIGS